MFISPSFKKSVEIKIFQFCNIFMFKNTTRVYMLTATIETCQLSCVTFIPYCSLETNLVIFVADSLKLSAHALAHNYSEPCESR